MKRHPLKACCIALGLSLILAQPVRSAEQTDPTLQFTDPLSSLKFKPGLEQYQFERATLDALRISDPLETLNRRLYHFNYRFDQFVFLPMVRSYRKVTPHPVRTGISNLFANLREVPTLGNSLLQLKFRRAGISTSRLLFNSILGVGGLWDPASKMGLEKANEDFGQTLGHYGVPPGPYLMLPFLGPSSLRDATGQASDYFLQKEIDWMNYSAASRNNPELHLLEIIDARHITQMAYGQLNSPFEYEKIRYIYTKARELQIRD